MNIVDENIYNILKGYIRNKGTNKATLSQPSHHLEVKVPVTLAIVLGFWWRFTFTNIRCKND